MAQNLWLKMCDSDEGYNPKRREGSAMKKVIVDIIAKARMIRIGFFSASHAGEMLVETDISPYA